jgi:hypothetical protein
MNVSASLTQPAVNSGSASKPGPRIVTRDPRRVRTNVPEARPRLVQVINPVVERAGVASADGAGQGGALPGLTCARTGRARRSRAAASVSARSPALAARDLREPTHQHCEGAQLPAASCAVRTRSVRDGHVGQDAMFAFLGLKDCEESVIHIETSEPVHSSAPPVRWRPRGETRGHVRFWRLWPCSAWRTRAPSLQVATRMMWTLFPSVWSAWRWKP